MMTDHTGAEPTPTTPATPVPAAAGWDDPSRPDKTSVEGHAPTEAMAARVSPDELVLLAELADPPQRRPVLPEADRDRLADLVVLGYRTTPGQGVDLTERGLVALDAVHVGAHGDYVGLDVDGVWHRPHSDPTPAPAPGWGWGAVRLTITVCPRRRTVLRIAVDHAWDYPPEHLRRVLAAAADRAVEDLDPRRGSTDPIPTPRCAPDQPPAGTAEDQPGGGWSAPRDEEITRRRVLRLLDQGHTVVEAAARFGVDPAAIDRWDDDAATDARIDLLADGPGCHPGGSR